MSLPTVSFATCCWERDWRTILFDPDYLSIRQIGNHCFPFAEKILVINNVSDLEAVQQAAQRKIDEGILTRYIVAEESILSFFQLNRSDFQPGPDAIHYPGVNADWIYYNALAPLAAIYEAKSDYLLYLTGDVRLDQPLNWIEKALRWMEKDPRISVANPVWNEKYKEAKKESYKSTWNFYAAKQGFSDQLFLVKQCEFRQPIYGEIRTDGSHYPRGDVFEKRVYSYLKNRDKRRIIFRRGSYTHENI